MGVQGGKNSTGGEGDRSGLHCTIVNGERGCNKVGNGE
jgi:hypothetical protein